MELGIISDTHGYMDERILHHFRDVDAILHAGDVGDLSVCDKLVDLHPLYCVYGNIDGTNIRKSCPEWIVHSFDGVKILMIHIAGALGKYNAKTRGLIEEHRPHVLICGHSHILKVAQDSRFDLLHINPGAAGKHGFHKMRTMLKVSASNGKLTNLRVVELSSRSA
ncbi:MAG: metallophosphoesterase family protein [Flavobacteriales bacterium]